MNKNDSLYISVNGRWVGHDIVDRALSSNKGRHKVLRRRMEKVLLLDAAADERGHATIPLVGMRFFNGSNASYFLFEDENGDPKEAELDTILVTL